MTRLLTVWIPDWPVVAAGAAEVPAVVLRGGRVVARSRAAAHAGVHLGHGKRLAQRACPDAVLVDDDPLRDVRAFDPVVRAVAEIAPRVEVVEPGWLAVATRGPSRYVGGDTALAERVTAIVSAAGVCGFGVGIADGRATSAIAARRSVGRSPTVIDQGGSRAFLDGLAVAWLRELGDVPPDLVDLLGRLGIGTLGAFAALPAGDVLARFGWAGRHAHRLAGGDDDRPPNATDPPPERCVERTFDEPVAQLAPLVFVAKQLADAMVAGLADEGRVCTRLVVVAETEHGERSERAWYRAEGLSAAAVVDRVRWQLDAWITSGSLTAGVALLRLVPDEVRADDGDQLGFWGGRSEADDAAHRAITRLTALAGEQAVLVPEPLGGRLPHETHRWVPAATVELDRADRLVSLPGDWPGSLPAPSPATVLVEPVPVEVLDPSGRPVRVTGRGEVTGPPDRLVLDGRARRVMGWAGPWPVDQRWWDPRRHRRIARFQLVTDDGAARLVAVEQQCWSVLAVYD
jgi:protein ImuB